MLRGLTGINWLRSLVSTKQVVIDSSTEIIQAIQNRQNQQRYRASGVAYKTPRAVANFAAVQPVDLAPLDLLRSIGIITTPIISNFADLSSTWAISRYFWAFAPDSATMCLSGIAKNIDFHQKGLLSDEIGVGMVYWIMRRFFGGSGYLDFDVAMRNPEIAQNMGISPFEWTGEAKPDYIFVTRNGGFAVVESKGTQSGRSASLDQIRRGLEQVPTIVFDDGTIAEEYVIATSITERNTTVFVIDPPNEDRGPEKGDISKKMYHVKDKAKFYKSTKRLQAAKLAAFAGAGDLAAQIAGLGDDYIGDRHERPDRRDNRALGTTFFGQSQIIRMRGPLDLRYSIFLGLAEEIYRDISSDSFISDDVRHDEQPGYAEHMQQFQESHLAENERSAFSADKDGTILEITLLG